MTTGTLEAGAIPSRLAIARLAIGAAIAAFVITRVYLLLLFVAHGTDLFIYFNYAVRGVDLGQSAYRDFAVEYPPLAYWLMTVPRHLAAERLAAGDLNRPEVMGPAFGAFAFAFRALMLLADALSFALICRVARLLNPRSVSWVAWGYLAITTTMHQFLYDRLDIGLLLLLLVWAHGRVAASGRAALTFGNILSYVALGLSVPYKLVGLFVLPLVLWGDWLVEGGDWRAARRVAWLGLAGAAAAAVPFLVQGLWSGGDVFGFLAY
ncbi:MAG: hypothetical protein J5I93_15890, partial [Pirellulaceae bacterium]|nr:hypothetical protein [Pirellulaceae bacterium]